MKQSFFVLLVLFLLALGATAWGVCPEDTLDSGECDTMYVEPWPADLIPGSGSPYFARVPIYVTCDLVDEYDSIAGFVIPLWYTHSNPTKYCSVSAYWNTTSTQWVSPDFSTRSIFRHIVEGTDTLYHNRMADMAADFSGRDWDTRILNVESDSSWHQCWPDSIFVPPHFWLALLPTGWEDQWWWEGSRVLLATMTFKLEDSMTICIDTCFWPPTGHLAWAIWAGIKKTPRPGTGDPNSFEVCFNVEPVEPVECDTIPLHSGWQWVSTSMDPDPCEMESIFVNCWGDLDIIIACDGSFCIPGVGCWIDCWDVCEMYNLHMSDACTIQVCGSKVPTDKPCPLPAGWNCIAYFPECPLEPETALVSIWSNLNIVKNDDGEFCIPGVGCWIDCMEPNEGYKAHLSSPDTLIYPTSCPPCPPPFAKKDRYPGFAQTTHFNYPMNTGESYSIVVNSVDFNGKHAEVGDEIGVFTPSELCVGAGVWQRGITGIAVWQDDDRTEAKDGFTVGEKMVFKLWNRSENKEIELSAIFDKGDGKFGTDAYALANLKGISSQLPERFELAQNYPNPFNPETKISYSLPKDCDVKLTIYNIMGQKIRVLVDEHQTAGCKSVLWDGKNDSGDDAASGIYFYRIRVEDPASSGVGDFSDTKKLMLLR